MQYSDLSRTVAILAMSFALFLAQADVIHGTTMGSTVSAPALTDHPNVRDDIDTATTIDVTFVMTSTFITADAGRFPASNFVFASLSPGGEAFAPPVGLDVSPIDPGDFTIDSI